MVVKKIDPASAKSATAGKKPAVIAKKQVLRGKNIKKKKEHLKFGVDCTNIAEDNILDVADFVSLFIENINYRQFSNLFFNLAGEVPQGALQGRWQDRQLGQQRHIRASKDESLRHIRCALLKALSQVSDQEILEETLAPWLDPCRVQR